MPDTKLTVELVQKMKVADLKKELKDRGLPVAGTKAELSERLTKSLQDANISGEQDLSLGDENISLAEHEDELLKEEKKTESEEPPKKKIALIDQVKIIPEPVKSPTEEKTKISFSSETDSEKLKKRSERFGVKNEESKLEIRAQRFGITNSSENAKNSTEKSTKLTSTPVTAGDIDKLKKRAERFGSNVSTALSKLEEEERVRKRKARFGAITTTDNGSKAGKVAAGSIDVQKQKRAERFGLS